MQKVSKQTKTSKKDHTFYFAQKALLILRTSTYLTMKTICSHNIAKNLSDFAVNMFLFGLRKNICTAPHLDAQELHSWSILKANVCIFLYISLRKFLFQRGSKLFSGKVWDGGRLYNFLKAACCLGLPKWFTIFHFNWYF